MGKGRGSCFSAPVETRNTERLEGLRTPAGVKISNERHTEPNEQCGQSNVPASGFSAPVEREKAVSVRDLGVPPEGPDTLGLPYSPFLSGPYAPPAKEGGLDVTKLIEKCSQSPQDRPFNTEVQLLLQTIQSVFGAPVAIMALFHENQVFVSDSINFKRGDFPWRWSLCGWTRPKDIPTTLVIPDTTKDARFSDNAFVAGGPGIRFYAGAPLLAYGQCLGTMCFADLKPRPDFSASECALLNSLAALGAHQLELALVREHSSAAPVGLQRLMHSLDCYATCIALVDTSDDNPAAWTLVYANDHWQEVTGVAREHVVGQPLLPLVERREVVLPARRSIQRSTVPEVQEGSGEVAEGDAEAVVSGITFPWPQGKKEDSAQVQAPAWGLSRHVQEVLQGQVVTLEGIGFKGQPGGRRLRATFRPVEAHVMDTALTLPVGVPSFLCSSPAPSTAASTCGSASYSASSHLLSTSTYTGSFSSCKGSYSIDASASGAYAPVVKTCAPASEARAPRSAHKPVTQSEVTGAASVPGKAARYCFLVIEAPEKAGVSGAQEKETAQPSASASLPLVGARAQRNSSCGSGVRSSKWTYGSQPLPGLTLGTLLGKGGFGAVYSAQYRDPATGAVHQVAAKVVDNKAVSRAFNGVTHEHLLSVELSHPHIVKVYKGAVRFDELVAVAGASLRPSLDAMGPGAPPGTGMSAALDQQGWGSGHDGLSGAMVYGVGGCSGAAFNAMDFSGQSVLSGAEIPTMWEVMGAPLRPARPSAAAQGHPPLASGQSGAAPPSAQLATHGAGGAVGGAPASGASAAAALPMASGETCMVMEFCDMGCLQDAIDKGFLRTERSQLRGKPHMPAICMTAYEIASALEHLHARGLVHGDVSSQNVLLCSLASQGGAQGATPAHSSAKSLSSSASAASATPSSPPLPQRSPQAEGVSPPRAMQELGQEYGGRGWLAKVSDLGLAKALTPGQGYVQCSMMGLLTHAAPEVLTQGRVSPASDVYSLGVVLWSMFTGARPWAGMSEGRVIAAVAGAAQLQFLNPPAPTPPAVQPAPLQPPAALPGHLASQASPQGQCAGETVVMVVPSYQSEPTLSCAPGKDVEGVALVQCVSEIEPAASACVAHHKRQADADGKGLSEGQGGRGSKAGGVDACVLGGSLDGAGLTALMPPPPTAFYALTMACLSKDHTLRPTAAEVCTELRRMMALGCCA